MARNRQRNSGILALLFFALAAAMLVVMCGCGKSPVSPEQDLERFKIESFILVRCNELGVHPEVVFTERVQCINVDSGYEDTLSFEDTFCPSETQVPAAMWASGNTISVWVNIIGWYSDSKLNAYAKHECAHLFYGHNSGNPNAEQEADACVANWPDC